MAILQTPASIQISEPIPGRYPEAMKARLVLLRFRNRTLSPVSMFRDRWWLERHGSPISQYLVTPVSPAVCCRLPQSPTPLHCVSYFARELADLTNDIRKNSFSRQRRTLERLSRSARVGILVTTAQSSVRASNDIVGLAWNAR